METSQNFREKILCFLKWREKKRFFVRWKGQKKLFPQFLWKKLLNSYCDFTICSSEFTHLTHMYSHQSDSHCSIQDIFSNFNNQFEHFTSHPFLKNSRRYCFGFHTAVSTVSTDVLLYISGAIKASFMKFDMCNICKTTILLKCV